MNQANKRRRKEISQNASEQFFQTILAQQLNTDVDLFSEACSFFFKCISSATELFFLQAMIICNKTREGCPSNNRKTLYHTKTCQEQAQKKKTLSQLLQEEKRTTQIVKPVLNQHTSCLMETAELCIDHCQTRVKSYYLVKQKEQRIRDWKDYTIFRAIKRLYVYNDHKSSNQNAGTNLFV